VVENSSLCYPLNAALEAQVSGRHVITPMMNILSVWGFNPHFMFIKNSFARKLAHACAPQQYVYCTAHGYAWWYTVLAQSSLPQGGL